MEYQRDRFQNLFVIISCSAQLGWVFDSQYHRFAGIQVGGYWISLFSDNDLHFQITGDQLSALYQEFISDYPGIYVKLQILNICNSNKPLLFSLYHGYFHSCDVIYSPGITLRTIQYCILGPLSFTSGLSVYSCFNRRSI